MALALKSSLSSTPLVWAVGGWSLFIAENVILSENRTWIIEQCGEDTYHYTYGAFSTFALTSIGYGYQYKVKNMGPFAWALKSPIPIAAKAASFIILSTGFVIASQTFPKIQLPLHYESEKATTSNEVDGSEGLKSDSKTASRWKVRCPFDFTDSKSTTNSLNKGEGKELVELHGLDRISRHPGLWSFGLIGLGSGLLASSLPTRVWMSMPIVVALVGGSHTDSRHRRGMGGYLSREMDEVTSNVPFLAMLSGRQGSVNKAVTDFSAEIKPLNALVAVGMATAVVASRGRGNRTIPSIITR